MRKKQSETKNGEILQAINTFSDHMEERFDHLETNVRQLKVDVGELKSDVGELKSDVGELKSDVGELKSDVNQLKGTTGYLKTAMVTKDYLDEKLMNLKGDMLIMMRKEDHKLGTLVQILDHKKVISKKDSHLIMSLEPFPRK